MSVKVDDFELKLNVDPIEASNYLNGEKSFELTARIDIAAAETLMEPSVAHEVRVSEGNETLIGDNEVKVNNDEFNLGFDSQVPKFNFEVNENQRLISDTGVISNLTRDDKEKIEVSRLHEDEPNMINLVVDLNSCKVPYVELKSENRIGHQGTEFRTDNAEVNTESVTNNVLSSYEKEGEFNVGDIVWGKVRSHPWWPGQIFDTSASSNEAMKYFKKDRFLIAYFGDQSFAFNEALQIKPFRMNFARMVNQSNMESFCHAVDCALDEVSRRVEFGLACSCLSKEVYSKIKSQFVANAGIRKGSSRRDGGDRFSSVGSFKPEKFVRCLKLLAEDPFGGTDRLEFVIARAQFLAFNRWKGFNQLAAHQVLDELFDNDEKGPNEAIEGTNEKIQDKKRKKISGDVLYPRKKEKCASELMAESCSMKRETSFKSSDRKRKAVDFGFNGSRGNKVISPPKKLTKLGERIRRVVSQLSRSSPIKTSQEDKNDVESTWVFNGNSSSCTEKFDAGKIIQAEYPPVDEMLSKLYMAAVDPMNGQHSSLISTVSFFSNFRNRVSLETNGKTCDEAIETSGFEGMEDSYWTDRIVQGNLDEQVLFEPIVVESSDHNQENSAVNLENKAEKKLKEDCSPTALILNFSNLNSVPSETNLNEIFCRYGPLNETETEVMKKGNRAKVVFKRRCDAETAFSSAGKFSIFGPSLVSYRLNYSPTPRKKTSTPAKRTRKDVNGN